MVKFGETPKRSSIRSGGCVTLINGCERRIELLFRDGSVSLESFENDQHPLSSRLQSVEWGERSTTSEATVKKHIPLSTLHASLINAPSVVLDKNVTRNIVCRMVINSPSQSHSDVTSLQLGVSDPEHEPFRPITAWNHNSREDSEQTVVRARAIVNQDSIRRQNFSSRLVESQLNLKRSRACQVRSSPLRLLAEEFVDKFEWVANRAHFIRLFLQQ